ncbi:MAG: transporter substrate-binding domain-containing protein [Aestuariivita sp.]|nr:transporter substrate-binding domain-containing protein [Aestuariivita sp.]MCY4203974.1 transporter substrate-binding domain-containing protein [Aestuariivita sp.]MCY4289679.1 transporter substrate-binding domain-containing protein [Aestuariivita sp.]MCY4348076.1 transporter substrate-binding domain-containing protein [Aestuariivita sp.]
MEFKTNCQKFIRSAAIGAVIGFISATTVNADGHTNQELNQELADLVPQVFKDAGVIYAAGAFDNPPSIFADLNDPNKAKGIAPELGEAISPIIGVPIEFRNTQWPGQLPGLDAGTFGLVWGQLSVTAERERNVLDLIPWYQSSLALMVPGGNPKNISDWASMCGTSVGVAIGSIYIKVIENASAVYCTPDGKPAITTSEFQGSEVPALQAGQVDSVMDTVTVMAQMAASINGIDSVALPPEQSFEFFPGLAGIGISKEHPGLSMAIAGALEILYENGTWQAIADANGAGGDIPTPQLIKVNALTDTPAGETTN